jgi:hypothetical protein
MVSMAESLIYNWFDRSHIEYRDLYMRLYIAYNAWYRKTTGKDSDFEAMRALRTRFILWDEYVEGRSLVDLREIMIHIVVMTRNKPIRCESGYWDGIVKDSDDWKGLIHFWYEVRCGLFHGSLYAARHTQETKLAYESLYIFMSEIVKRMKATFHNGDLLRLGELQILAESNDDMRQKYVQEQRKLRQKYIASGSLWNVDMMRQS